MKSHSFGAFERENLIHERRVSYNLLTPKITTDEEGQELPYIAPKIQPRMVDITRLLGPYFGTRLFDQMRAVIPLALYLAFFQIFILRQEVAGLSSIIFGISAVIIGLMCFMEGLRLGLMPFANIIGSQLPKKLALGFVLGISMILGIGVTFAEPAIGALQAVGSIIKPEQAPYLFALLNIWSTSLVMVVGIGVGLAAIVGTLRLLFHWSLKPFILIALLPVLLLSAYCARDPYLKDIIGLAWDCGAVTTGPVTVPLVLALGIGIASTQGKGGSALSGFGIVTMASLFPILAVLLLGITMTFLYTPAEVIAMAANVTTTHEIAWYQRTPIIEILTAVQAIVPLVMFLFFILYKILREDVKDKLMLYYGLSLCLGGMAIFNIGLTYGLSALGEQAGSIIPSAFIALDWIEESPLFPMVLGIAVALLFAWILGLGSTLAEPALNAMGMTVQEITNGAFKKSLLIWAVSIGVGFGITAGVAKIIFDLPLFWMLLTGYGLVIILTLLSSEEFVNVAWDSAGVTTGPVTVPLVLAMGVGLGDAVSAREGFGVLSMASVFPIMSVLATGLYVRYRRYYQTKQIEKLKEG